MTLINIPYIISLFIGFPITAIKSGMTVPEKIP